MSHNFRLGAAPLYLLFCLLLGGASAAGIWANLLLQLVGLALIVWSLSARRRTPIGTPARQLIALMTLGLLIVVVQLVPMPPSLWTELGGRERIAAGFELLGQPLPWLPISLSPRSTLAAGVWTVPAMAMLLLVARLGAFRTTWLAWTIVAVAAISAAIGALQIADQSWYFYQVTNFGAGVGFFANANHQATFLVSTIPFLPALYLASRRKGGSTKRTSGLLVILIGIFMILLVGLALNGSLAGIGIAIPVIVGSAGMLWLGKRKLPGWAAGLMLLVTAGALAIPLSAPLGNNLTTTEAKSSQFSRYTTFKVTAQAAREHLPFGSGLGTFIEIYRTYEDPVRVEPTFINRAHSDYLELFLETGLLAAPVVLLFLIWWAWHFWRAWRSDAPDYFARAAGVASAAMLIHSVVDYPLRTAAISAIFAMCCALLADARPSSRRNEQGPAEKQARHLSA
jgi:O-antigen ligase